MRKFLAFLILGLTALACSLSPFPASTPDVSPPFGTDVGPDSVTQAVPTLAPTQSSAPALTIDQLKNAQYQLVFLDSRPTVQLTNGSYQSGSDPASPDFVSVNLGEPIAFGDLNDDGATDAAVALAENYGGTGVFVSVVAMLNQNGQPVQAAAEMIDDRPIINALSIQDEEILLDATVHGPNDPGCCASQSTQRMFRYQAGRLVMTRLITRTADGRERVITIDSPLDGSAASWPLAVSGHVAVAPFENNLVYSVFGAKNNQVTTGSLIVNADQPGGPGTFSFSLDLGNAALTGPVRIQIEDSSPADGSILALASITVNIK